MTITFPMWFIILCAVCLVISCVNSFRTTKKLLKDTSSFVTFEVKDAVKEALTEALDKQIQKKKITKAKAVKNA